MVGGVRAEPAEDDDGREGPGAARQLDATPRSWRSCRCRDTLTVMLVLETVPVTVCGLGGFVAVDELLGQLLDLRPAGTASRPWW